MQIHFFQMICGDLTLIYIQKDSKSLGNMRSVTIVYEIVRINWQNTYIQECAIGLKNSPRGRKFLFLAWFCGTTEHVAGFWNEWDSRFARPLWVKEDDGTAHFLFLWAFLSFVFMDSFKYIPGREVSPGNSYVSPHTQPRWIPSPSDSLISHRAFPIQKSNLASDELGYSVSDSRLHSRKSVSNCPLFSNAASFLLCLRRSGTLFNLSLLYRSIVQGAVMKEWCKRPRTSWPENVLPRKSFQARTHAQQQKAALQSVEGP